MLNELDQYQGYLARLPISDHTRRNYLGRVRQYLLWLAGSPDAEQALVDPVERDFAVHDYKMRLLQSGRSSYTVNAVLASLDNFHQYKGIGPAKVKRQDLPLQAPRALEPEEQRRLLKVIAQSRSSRNRAVALIMLHCGLRISEVKQLNVGDIALSARRHEVVVRCGKNAKRRVVPINTDLATAMREYLSSVSRSDPESPLFTSQKGNRLSVQAIDQIVRQFGRDSGVEFSSHSLRHTCLTRLIRAGTDIVTVAEIAGHSGLKPPGATLCPPRRSRHQRWKNSAMVQRKLKQGQRPRISVSLDPDDYEWVQSFKGPSESYTVSRLIKAARLSGLTLDEAMTGGVLEELRDWLKRRRKKSAVVTELAALLTEYLDRS